MLPPTTWSESTICHSIWLRSLNQLGYDTVNNSWSDKGAPSFWNSLKMHEPNTMRKYHQKKIKLIWINMSCVVDGWTGLMPKNGKMEEPSLYTVFQDNSLVLRPLWRDAKLWAMQIPWHSFPRSYCRSPYSSVGHDVEASFKISWSRPYIYIYTFMYRHTHYTFIYHIHIFRFILWSRVEQDDRNKAKHVSTAR